jgi:tetratricopeptide (TPR) repeat protein
MARNAARGFWSHVRAFARMARHCLAAAPLAAALACAVPNAASADPAAPAPVKGEATFTEVNGFARLVLKLDGDVASDVTTAGSIVIIHFEHPVDISVDRLGEEVPNYVASARIDPDGTAIRLSLARRVTINTMSAAERTFVDFLPDSWTGPPPPLPTEVVRELAERARAAERALRQQRAEATARKRPPIRVRALVQPTFVRYVFEMPDGVGASSMFNDQKLTISFNAPLTFDLADAKIAAPPNIASINQKVDGNMTLVEIEMIGDVDVHSFREDKTYNIDVAFQQPDKAKVQTLPTADAAHAPAPAAEAPKKETAPEQHSEAITPPTSESIAREMKADDKSRQAAASPAPAAMEAPKPATAPAPSPRVAEATKPETAKPDAIKPEVAKPEGVRPEAVKPAVAPAPMASDNSKKDTPPPPAVDEAKPPAPDAAKGAEVPKQMTSAAPADQAKPQSKPDAKSADDAVKVDAWRDSDGLRLTFAFPTVTPAAAFRRGDTVWLIFDSTQPFDVGPIRAKGGAIIGEISRMPLDNAQAVRIRLGRPQMYSLDTDERASGLTWTLSFADRVENPPQPLSVVRNITDPALANLAISLANAGAVHRLVDPDAGDSLLVVTATPPIRGFIKRQDFVDCSLLDTAHGIAIRPNSDEVKAEISGSKVIVGKPGGLTLSPVAASAERAPMAVRPLFDIEEWRKNQTENFDNRLDALIRAIGDAEPDQRPQARLDLARFYMARGMYYEAKGVTEVALADSNPKKDETITLMLHAVASILTDRPAQALKDLASSAIGTNYDSQMWQALALERQSKWAEAREKFKTVEFAIASLPLELQRIVTADAMRASLEVRDYGGAAKRRAELDAIGVSGDTLPAVSVLQGRLDEALGHERDALDEYKTATASDDRKAAAEAKLFEIALKQKRKEINQADALRELETLSVTWRGDAIEVKTLQMLSQLYTETGRYAESLQAARTATLLEPNSETSRAVQDAASALFSQIFLSEKGDELPPIDALGMFYEFRALTPIGRRGDEMIRRLADRLVAVDLLDQAAELLQYQVDHRLEGSARAQVAAKLAMVYLMNRKPDLAITALRSTRIADLSGELRQQRLLLEARAQSDIGRHDLALDIVSNISGREAIRLRSDIYWAARRWRESAEQIELYYGDRWRDFRPLSGAEKSDVIRAVVGYALAEDAIGLARFREKYAPLMSGEADKIAFDTASQPKAANSGDFAAIAKMAAGVDTMDGFLREMKARFPDGTARPAADPNPTGSLPQIVGVRRASG